MIRQEVNGAIPLPFDSDNLDTSVYRELRIDCFLENPFWKDYDINIVQKTRNHTLETWRLKVRDDDDDVAREVVHVHASF